MSRQTPAGDAVDYLVVPMGDGHDSLAVIHEPCGAQVLCTMTVHLDTVVRLASEHVCAT